MKRLERQMEQLAVKEEKLHAELVEAATDPERLQTLNAELKGVVEEKDAAEAQWLEVAELLD